jgi:adenosine deaminase
MVDQLLILREAVDSHVTLPSTEAAAGLVTPYAAESSYQADLVRYGISERDLAAHLLAGLRTLTFTDLRFRPDIVVSADDIRSYYDSLVRQSASAAAPLQSFEESRDQIEKLLVEQRVLEALDQWLETARSAARVQYREKAFQ